MESIISIDNANLTAINEMTKGSRETGIFSCKSTSALTFAISRNMSMQSDKKERKTESFSICLHISAPTVDTEIRKMSKKTTED
ncbi:MAG: hypothetical protein PHW02_00965 [bacterium]|nr:hypothetical protein [bacterium]